MDLWCMWNLSFWFWEDNRVLVWHLSSAVHQTSPNLIRSAAKPALELWDREEMGSRGTKRTNEPLMENQGERMWNVNNAASSAWHKAASPLGAAGGHGSVPSVQESFWAPVWKKTNRKSSAHAIKHILFIYLMYFGEMKQHININIFILKGPRFK